MAALRTAQPVAATFLLPAAARFGAQRPSAEAAAALARADRRRQPDQGRVAQLRRYFEIRGGGWPIAALSRQREFGDAHGAAWLRADPVWLRADINGVRLMAHGAMLALEQADRDALLPALKPLFGDAGFALDAPTPARWYLRLPREARIPAFADPGEALGEDVFEHGDTSAEARKWRALASEAQVLLHHHPRNAERAARGLPPINALWFWGGGTLSQAAAGERAVRSAHQTAFADDDTLQALAASACTQQTLPPVLPELAPGSQLFDLSALRDLRAFERDWLLPALAQLRRGPLRTLTLDAEDGEVHVLRRWQRLRFWRRPRQERGT